MKKFLALLLACMLLAAPVHASISDQTNKIFLIKGDVKVRHAEEGSKWRQMDTSTVLQKGDAVKTAGDSTADIIIGPNAEKVLKVAEKSNVEFNEINPANLNFPQGKIMVAIKKLEPKSSFVVKTPTAICGARGTGWSEIVSPSETKICVFENAVFVKEVDEAGRPKRKEHTAKEGTERVLLKDEPISEAKTINEKDLSDWDYWHGNVKYLREGKILVNDFNRKENYNNLDGNFGSWNVFYADTNQYCKDELSEEERMGNSGYSLKLTYDVDTQFSAYNGFFTQLKGIDLSDYKYLIFYIKGDTKAGYTTKINLELKNRMQTGKTTVEGITDKWQKITVPLNRFSGINSFKEMKELVIVFSDLGVTKKQGIIYIDDIYFAKSES